jgi:hypothetical protein
MECPPCGPALQAGTLVANSRLLSSGAVLIKPYANLHDPTQAIDLTQFFIVIDVLQERNISK